MVNALRVTPSGDAEEKGACKAMTSIRLCIQCHQSPQLVGSWCGRECRLAYYGVRNKERARKRLEALAATDVTCKGCGGLFRRKKTLQEKYCSQKCRQDSLNKRSRVNSMSLHHFTCRWCQSRSVSRNRETRCCSAKCSDALYHFRKSRWKPSSVSTCSWCGFGFLGKGDFCSTHCECKGQMIVAVMLLTTKLADRARVWASCVECGDSIVVKCGRKYCSTRCERKAYRRTGGYKQKKARWRKSWKKRNPSKAREQKVRHKQRRRARKRENGVEPTAAFRTIMTATGTNQACFYCGADCTGNHHWDHFIPISKGGPDAPWNLVVSCPRCNLSKRDKLPESIFCDELGLVT